MLRAEKRKAKQLEAAIMTLLHKRWVGCTRCPKCGSAEMVKRGDACKPCTYASNNARYHRDKRRKEIAAAWESGKIVALVEPVTKDLLHKRWAA
jgi:hypothetical protein